MDSMDMENLVNHAIDIANALDNWQTKDNTMSLDSLMNYEDITNAYLKENPFADKNEVKGYLIGYVRGTNNGLKEAWEILKGDEE